MLTTAKRKSGAWIVVVAAVITAVALAIVLFVNQRGGQIPVTGVPGISVITSGQVGMSQRAINAYSARYDSLAGKQVGMSQRAITAYEARLNGLAGNQAGMSQQAINAYSARLSSMAGLQAGMSSREISTYSARLDAMAKYYQSLQGK